MTQVLVVDHSGRGHATADLFVRTNADAEVHYVPGCAAVTDEGIRSQPTLSMDEPEPLVTYARHEGIDLVYVSNPVAVAAGFVDAFRAAGLRVVGPDRRAARIESSKVEAKQLFERYGIPSPEHVSFDDVDAALAHVRACPYQVVVKADGMSAGNGAYVCDDASDAVAAIHDLMVDRIFGAAGDRTVVERRYYGRELSYFALVDGQSYVRLPMSLDYPKSDDGNRGVDSAGMGALSPHPLDSEELAEAIERSVLEPVMRCIAEERLHYTGVIYLGCMLVDGEPLLLEINARMGDPEAEVVFPRIESDFVGLSEAMVDGTLDAQRLELNDKSFCTISITQGPTDSGLPGWPYGEHDRGHPITGLDRVDASRCRLFIGQATVVPGKGLTTDGGRVAQACGFGATMDDAVENAYANVGHIDFAGVRYRNDIGRILPWETGPAIEEAPHAHP
jgi:phosphoribosylamine---glycine ligase